MPCHISLRDTNFIPWEGYDRLAYFLMGICGLMLLHALVHNSFIKDDFKNLLPDIFSKII